MKPRIRPLSNLYHRWGAALGLTAEACARALSAAGLLRMLDRNHYSEVLPDPPLSLADWDALILRTLREASTLAELGGTGGIGADRTKLKQRKQT